MFISWQAEHQFFGVICGGGGGCFLTIFNINWLGSWII
jgi:hypothetical protein